MTILVEATESADISEVTSGLTGRVAGQTAIENVKVRIGYILYIPLILLDIELFMPILRLLDV